MANCMVTIKANTADFCARLERMSDFLEANPDHPVAARMAAFGEIELGTHVKTVARKEIGGIVIDVAPVGEFAEIMAEFEGMAT